MANAISEIKERHAAANQQIKVTAQTVGEIYEDVRLRLNQRLQAFVLSGSKDHYKGKALVDCIEAIGKAYSDFEGKFREEMGRAVPYVAESYYIDALNDMGEKVLGEFDKQRAEAMLQDSYSHIAGATEFMSATQVGNLRNTVSRVLRTAGMTGMTSREVQGELLRLLTADFAFTDAKGRVWNTEAYTKMLARTTLMNAGREAYLDTCADKGKDVVRISISGDACPKCAEWENRLVSLSGKTKGLPLLQTAIDGGLFHPNCTHSTVAVGDWDRETNFDKKGRPKEGWNNAKNPNPKGDDPEANREYRKRQAEKAKKKADAAGTKSVNPPAKTKSVTEKYTKNAAAQKNTIQIPMFKTKKDAKKFIKEKIANDDFLPSDTSLEVYQKIAETLYPAMKKYNIDKFAFLDEKYGNTIASMRRDNAIFGINPGQWEAIIKNPEQFFYDIVSYFEKIGDIRFLAVDKPENILQHVVDHEFGHAIFNRSKLKNKEMLLHSLFEKEKKSGMINKISQYAADKDREFFAEIFAMYQRGDKLPEEYIKFITEVSK